MRVTEFFVNLLSFLTDEVIVFIVSMVPLIELRGSLPVAVLWFDLPPWSAFLLAYPASLIPAPFIILLIRRIFTWLEKITFFKKIIDRVIHRTQEKHHEKIEKYGYLGLFIIVAIPLPGTGVWSGSLVAALFQLKFKKALLMIVLGNLVAALAIMGIMLGITSFFS